MDLKSGLPYSLIKNGLPYEYPKLTEDIRTGVAIVGCGISGALTAFYLIEAGIDCVTVDARSIGLGSTCASTSLLQYEIDVMLHRLGGQIGMEAAVTSYRLCAESINTLGNIAVKIGLQNFRFCPSVYFAAEENHTDSLKKECETRKKAGFAVSYLQAEEVQERYGFKAPGAIVSQLAAKTDAYEMTHGLHRHNLQKGTRIYDRTEITEISHMAHAVRLTTADGCQIHAKKIVYATGYEVTEMLHKKIVKLQNTYACISEPLTDNLPFWKDDALLWNTADPYLYIRTTPDRRIIIGGHDDGCGAKRSERRVASKAEKLGKDFRKLFPHIEFKTEFSWAGVFGSTKDGLPYIGTHPGYPNGYFALGFGGNGITFSVIAAEMIRDACLGKPNPNIRLFSFDR